MPNFFTKELISNYVYTHTHARAHTHLCLKKRDNLKIKIFARVKNVLNFTFL